jgi:hypothetical protein
MFSLSIDCSKRSSCSLAMGLRMRQVWQRNRRLVIAAALAIWGLLFMRGMAQLWKYDSVSGAPAVAPTDFPRGTRLAPAADRATLVLLMHPQCPCSRATVDELARLMTRCHGKLDTIVLMIRPNGQPDGWEKTDLWTSAAAIPGVSVRPDPGGVEAARFGAATSGQVLLYSPAGRLLFAGGITESRGHSGDNDGRSSVEALVLNQIQTHEARVASTPVYGCPLFGKSDLQKDGIGVCRK